MKKQLYLSIAIMIMWGVFAISGKAQTSASPEMRAYVPFAFTVGGKILPLGDYTVWIDFTDDSGAVLYAQSEAFIRL